MTAFLRSRLVVVVAVASGAALASAVTAACGSSAPPVQTGDDDVDASEPDARVTPDANGSGDTSPPDGASDARDANADALDSGPNAPDAADVLAPPVCNPDAGGSLGPGSLVITTTDPSILGAVTPDELVIAWTSIPADGGAAAVQWAERAHATDAFGAAQSLSTTFGPFAADHIGLSGDGLRLAFVAPSLLAITEVSRSARGTPFTTVSTTGDFNGVNPSGGSKESDPGLAPFGETALSPDFKRWAFVNGDLGFVVSEIQAGTWSTPIFPPGILPPAESKIRIQPSGWSSDDLTMFYWDQAALVARMTWLDRTSLQFVSSVDIGTATEWMYPSGDCTKVYYSTPSPDGGLGSMGIYVAARQQ